MFMSKKTFKLNVFSFVLALAVVWSSVFSLLPFTWGEVQQHIVYADESSAASEQSLKIKFIPRSEDLDKAWKVHLWIPGTANIYSFDLQRVDDTYTGSVSLASTQRIGYVIYHGNWQKDLGDQDRFADVQGNSILEVRQGEVTTTVTSDQPAVPVNPPASEKLTKVTLTVNYIREHSDYEGWNAYTWLRKAGQDTDAKSVDFENTKAVIVYENPEGIETVGLIVRKSTDTNPWAAKNTPDDLLISDFERQGQEGTKEIWIVESDPNIYDSEQAIPAASQIGLLHTKEFNEKYAYEGELGAIYTPEKTTFKLWAPTAQKVELIDYTNSPERNLGEMTKADRHWSFEYQGDAKLMKYRYRLHFANGVMEETPDPYAKSVTANGIHSVVIDSKNTVPEGWTGVRMPSFPVASEAIIYEAHVRDLTIGEKNGIQNKGKFLGLTEAGTTTEEGNPSGLDYLKSLGITHVQLLPIFDFATVDENASTAYNAQYNWGYDPQHFNAPEGSYSTNPNDPEARVKELKKLIQTLHDNGIRVIMDVVYNHVYNVERSPLHKTVPGYYFRYDRAGNLLNGTGVGNETASEQWMFRKYMIDSLKYWATEYNIDGFRFDLMGIHDVDTMNLIRAEMDRIDPSIILLGEGWDMGNHPTGVKKANQYNAEHMPRIAFFNDVFRDAVKGDNFNASNSGYVNHAQNADNAWKILNSIKSQYVVPYKQIDQNVVYNEAHDNYTLYDKLKQSTQNASEAEIIRMHTHATSLQTLAYGLMFVHAGQENLRTKYNARTNAYEHNSYNLSDEVNVFDYDRAAQYGPAHQYFKDLVKLRKIEDLFKLRSIQAINEKMEHLDGQMGGNKIAYKVNIDDKPYYVLSNAQSAPQSFTLPQGKYEVIVHDVKVNLVAENRTKFEGSAFEVAPNSVSIVRWVPEEPPVVLDLEPLRAVIALAKEEVKKDIYEPAGLQDLKTLLPQIEQALSEIEAGTQVDKTQAYVDSKKNALQAKIDALVLKPDVRALPNSLTNSIEASTEGRYASGLVFRVEDVTEQKKNHEKVAGKEAKVYDLYLWDTVQSERVLSQQEHNVKIKVGKEVEKIYYLPENAGEQVQDLVFSQDPSTKEVSFRTNHFSHYAIIFKASVVPVPPKKPSSPFDYINPSYIRDVEGRYSKLGTIKANKEKDQVPNTSAKRP